MQTAASCRRLATEVLRKHRVAVSWGSNWSDKYLTASPASLDFVIWLKAKLGVMQNELHIPFDLQFNV